MKITVPVEIALDVKGIEEDLYRAHIDYRHPSHCTLCNRELVHQEWMSVVRCMNRDYIVCKLCLEAVKNAWLTALEGENEESDMLVGGVGDGEDTLQDDNA